MPSPSARASDATVYAWTWQTLDVDALAKRSDRYQDIYTKSRDEALAAYAQANPGSHPYDDDARKLIRLTAYLWLWGDPYGEGLWPLASQGADHVKDAGATDPIVGLALDFSENAHDAEADADGMAQRATTFAGTAYPDVFKAWYYQTAIANLARIKAANASSSFPNDSAAALPGLVQKWGAIYEQLIRTPLPDSLLYAIGNVVESDTENDDSSLTLVDKEEDRAFAAVAPDSGVPSALDGLYYTDEAWLARGSGWANSVSDDQWKQFRDYLEKADSALEDGYAKHPQEAAIAEAMLKVELGQGQGRDRMETWFQRAIQADPLDYDAYSAKFWYLQPRWYGSEQDLIDFGQVCGNTKNGPSNLEMAFLIAVSQAHDTDDDAYKRPEVWTPISATYVDFLAKYPQSIRARTNFAAHAAQGGHWDIAKAQFALLGDQWDRSTLSASDYEKYQMELQNPPPAEDTTALSAPADSSSPGLMFRMAVWVVTVVSWVRSFVGL